MMPQAMTPLTLDAFVTNVAGMGQIMRWPSGITADTYIDVFGSTFCKHFFLNMYSGIYSGNEYTMGSDTKSMKNTMDILLFGGSTGDEYLEGIHKRYQTTYVPWYRKILGVLCVYTDAFSTKRNLKRSNTIVRSISTDFKTTDPLTLHRQIEDLLRISSGAWYSHVQASNVSNITSHIVTQVVKKKDSEHSEVMSDVALLLATCTDVISADVPASLRKMAIAVVDCGKAELFQSLTPEEAVDWLRSDESGRLKQDFATFIEIHGHRCVRESELSEKTWAMEPAKVVRTIQDMTKSDHQLRETKKQMTEDEALDNIKSTIGPIKKKILRFLLPYARAAVGFRENGKSLAIKSMDILRQAYLRLAQLLVNEGRLPEKELIFYLKHEEIAELIKTRSARLINKAVRLRKMMPALMAMEFQELITGYPTPIEDGDTIDVPTTGELKGMPVSHGVIRAKCRIVKSLDEANSIEQGEILIVAYTDIGWSPYFPLVSGLCTEMGGLMSHGAVIAREYGLPCIVSAKKATHIFKTGEEVILNGTLGTISKVIHITQEEEATE
ncbi:PREDICTED: putative phosphoenolpyruvate synthase [Priapulus caudatus]|uniref:Phosphoenolpyruvate synthase n=1 Tax=Priapulus caudatus TaxID=37621 RepID=A0ABM1FB13_PRICU|nr:PREDICTED: putative phosphoenolpyruvate synthase [Priapulus caudatus]